MMNMSSKQIRLTGIEDITSDRISSLPDEIRQHILSLMTAREAVQTCVLSTRWRYVWLSLQCLKIEVERFTSKLRFARFMDNLLLCRGLVPLDSFSLTGWKYHVSIKHPRTNLWICHAIRSNVRVLHICDSDEFFKLEHSSFTSSHLKILSLKGVSITDLFIEKLFSGCPQLEDLSIVDCRVLATKFSSSSLKNLTFVSLDTDDFEFTHSFFEDLVIDTPSLVSLHLEDLPGLAPCLVNVSSVVDVSIRLDEDCFPFSDVNCNILSALSNVIKLKLTSQPDYLPPSYYDIVSKVLRRDLWRCQAFNNLKTLSVSDWCMDADLQALVYVLRRSPLLQKLTLCLSEAATSDWGCQIDNPESKNDMSFNCEHLKKVEIRCPRGDKRVHIIVNGILANAMSLPEIVINPYKPLKP